MIIRSTSEFLNTIFYPNIKMVKVAVLGAGVNGLACAVRIKEKYNNFQVTVISSDFSPNTTGDGSGGLWFPYLYGSTPLKLIEKWASETFYFLRELWKTGAVNICLMPIYDLNLQKENFVKPDWVNLVFGWQELNNKQLECLNERYSSKYAAGHTFTTFVVPPSTILAYLRKRFEQANGEIVQATLTSLQDPILKEYDVIVNCTGLAARVLVPDEKVAPVRGQVAKVKAPWMCEVVMDDTGHYIIPNVDTCILGGTHEHSYSTKVDPKHVDFIMNGCKKIVPGLEHAKIVTHWAGLRPGREAVRLEAEEMNGKMRIHNYGHGGSGFTLFWGCSGEVLQLLDTFVNKNYISHRTSKL